MIAPAAARRRPRHAAQAGLTLLEVLAAVTIVAVALLALQSVMIQNIDRAVESNDERMVKVLLKQKVEEIRAGIEQGESGNFGEDGFPQYVWSSQQAERQVTENGEKVIELTVTVTYSDAAASGGFDDGQGAQPIEAKVTVLIDPPEAETAPTSGGN